MVALIFMLAVMILAMAVAVPAVRKSIQRDRELETMERGKQYIRAIQLYYKKFNSYPPNLDALIKTNNIRFLRKKYIDPTTSKEEWKPIMFGQNKTPQAMGFFGQPLAAASGAGIGPSGGNGLAGTSTPGSTTNPSTGIGLFGSNTPGDSSGTGGTGASTGTSSAPSAGAASGTTGGTDANGNPISGSTPASGATSGSTSAASGTTSAGTGTTSGSPTNSGQTFGGGGIIGFSPQSPKQSILVYKKKNHYNEWEFLYSPLSDQKTMSGGNTGTQLTGSTTNPVGGTTTPATPTPTPGAPTTPTSPMAPQQ